MITVCLQLSTQLSTALSTPANGLQQMGSSQVPNSLAAGGGPPIGANQLQTIGSGQLPSSLQPVLFLPCCLRPSRWNEFTLLLHRSH